MPGGIDLKALTQALKRTDQIISAPLRQWLIQHGDDPLDDLVAAKIMELLTTKPRIRHGSFSASSAGGCPRAQVLQYLGAPGEAIDAQLQNIFNDGKWRHLRWQAMLLMAGILHEPEFPLFWGAKRARGTMDGLGVVPSNHPRKYWRGKEFGFELKGVSGFQFGKYKTAGPADHHKDQVSRYFLMGGFDLFVIVYEDKSTQDWFEWVFEPEPERINQQRKEVEWLNESVSERSVPEMLPGCRRREGDAWKTCPFGHGSGVCPKVSTWPETVPISGL